MLGFFAVCGMDRPRTGQRQYHKDNNIAEVTTLNAVAI